MSEDPRLQLASTLYQKQQKQHTMQQQPDTDDTDTEDRSRRNPHEPIPAFTSIDVAKKLRYRSEDRYVNDRMERELKAYQ
jgi:hypothetical protein